LITAQVPGEAVLTGIDDHVMIHSNLMEPAPAAAAVVLAALADADATTPAARTQLLWLLLAFMAGDTIEQEACEAAIRGGVWLLYRELTTGPSIDARAHAYEILSIIDGEEDRLHAYHRAVSDRLPAYLR
jgi:hypothetical protein